MSLVDVGLVSKHLSTNISGETPLRFKAFCPMGNNRMHAWRSGNDHVAFREYQIAGTEPYLLEETRVLTNPNIEGWDFIQIGQAHTKNVHYSLFNIMATGYFPVMRFSRSNQCSTDVVNDRVYYNKLFMTLSSNPPGATALRNVLGLAIDGKQLYVGFSGSQGDDNYYEWIGRISLRTFNALFDAGNKLFDADGNIVEVPISFEGWSTFSRANLAFSNAMSGFDVENGKAFMFGGSRGRDSEPYKYAIGDLQSEAILTTGTFTSPEAGHYPQYAKYAHGFYHSIPVSFPSPTIAAGIRYLQWS
jgi:hypothetical protein